MKMKMFFKKKNDSVTQTEREIKLKKEVLDSILSFCNMKHPDEGILILRGKSKKGNLLIDGLIVPHLLLELILPQVFQEICCQEI